MQIFVSFVKSSDFCWWGIISDIKDFTNIDISLKKMAYSPKL
jgi:hypothetical protein